MLSDTLLNKLSILTPPLPSQITGKLRVQVFSHAEPAHAGTHFPRGTRRLQPISRCQHPPQPTTMLHWRKRRGVCHVPQGKTQEQSAPRENTPQDTCQGSKPNCFDAPKPCLPDLHWPRKYQATQIYPREGADASLVLLT